MLHHEEIDILLEKSKRLSFAFDHSPLNYLSVDDNNSLLNLNTDDIDIKLVSPKEHLHLGIWEGQTNGKDVELPKHNHISVEYIYIFKGSVKDQLNKKEYKEGNLIIVPSLDNHQFLIRSHTKFLIIFKPSMPVKKREKENGE